MAVNRDERLEKSQEGILMEQGTSLISDEFVNSEVEQEAASATQEADEQELLDGVSETSDESEKEADGQDVQATTDEQESDADTDEDEDADEDADVDAEVDVDADTDEDVDDLFEQDEAQPRTSLAYRMASSWGNYGQQ